MRNKFNLLALLLVAFLFQAHLVQSSPESTGQKLRPLVAGSDYEILPEPASEKPLLMEYFNYACSACYSMERFTAHMMKKKKGLSFGFVPVENHPSWRIYVKAFYIGQMTGVIDRSHHDLYDRVNRQKNRFNNDAEMKQYFLSLGVINADYDKVIQSKKLISLVDNAKKRAIKIGLRETPTFVVNNKYKLNIQSLGSYEMLEKAIDELSGLKLERTRVNKGI